MFAYQTIPMTNSCTPNATWPFDHFYLSFNDRDINSYGGVTTAIVLGDEGQSQLFLVLNGDHKEALSSIAQNSGLQACIDYFIDHINQANRYSEHLLAPYNCLSLLGQDNIDRINTVVSTSNDSVSA